MGTIIHCNNQVCCYCQIQRLVLLLYLCSFDHTVQAGTIRHALNNALAAFGDDYYLKTLLLLHLFAYVIMHDWCGPSVAGLLRRSDCHKKERNWNKRKQERNLFGKTVSVK